MNIAAVSYLNTAPLIEGLEAWDGCEIVRSVPSGIDLMVINGEADLGLVSIVDFARSGARSGAGGKAGGEKDGGLVMVPVGMIGCEGPTLTVRIFSSVPIEEITKVHADTDSHTSVVLCDLVLRELHGVEAEFVDFDVCNHGDEGWPEVMLMIGDKVVTACPGADQYPYSVDLGQAWFEMTGLPFVYAMWMCRADRVGDPEIHAAAMVLERTMLRNRLRLDWIVASHARRTGWLLELAQRYIGELLRFEVDDRARRAVEVFLSKAAAAKLIEGREPMWMEIDGELAGGKGGLCLR